ncbi:Protein of unknown function DUF3712 [Penicillium occitanis (nom. inval.)]|nr:hypothetical protein PENOC_106840 [Penicillium occitanis (nom. inval.)]PCG89480.1 Protein of unknown function DUF3712 [Penicillium occitanis (nom. inval.)]
MFNIEKPAVTGSTATGETKLPNSLDKLSESQKLATEKKVLHVAGLIVLLAIILPCLFLLVIPSIAQDLLNSGSIVIDAATVLQPQNDSVLLSIASHIYVPGPFTVQTEPTQGQLYVPQIGSAYPMAQLNLPGMRIHKNTNIRATSQYTVFENYTSWQSFVPDTIFLNTGGLGLKGKIITQLGNIKKFSLDIPSNGLNQLACFTIDSATLVLPAESDGTNLIANATLPNQSVLTMEIGNTSVKIQAGDIVIGQGVIENVYLTPGNNSHNHFQASPIHQKWLLALTTKVTEITYNGSRVPYYSDEMSTLALTAQTPLLELLLNTLSGFLHSNATNVTSALANGSKEHSTRSMSTNILKGIPTDSTELELIASYHLKRLIKL